MRREHVKYINLASEYNEVFVKPDIVEWLRKNIHIFHTFCVETTKTLRSGYKHFSGYALWEDIRHRTSVTEEDSRYKIDQNRCSDVIRLYVIANPTMFNYFRYKYSPRRKYFYQAVKIEIEKTGGLFLYGDEARPDERGP